MGFYNFFIRPLTGYQPYLEFFHGVAVGLWFCWIIWPQYPGDPFIPRFLRALLTTFMMIEFWLYFWHPLFKWSMPEFLGILK